MNKKFKENFKIAYKDLYDLHPGVLEESFNLRYLRTDWFFPHHLHNVLNQVKKISNLYFKDVELEVCFFAGLFHDAGLVYKREKTSPIDHEKRSVEYAENVLSAMGYNQEFIDKVSECIKATESDYVTSLPEALVVRNSDAYAHIISMHFFAKANFSNNMSSFVLWFEKKIHSTYKKITIPELQSETKVLVVFYEKMIENYTSNKKDIGCFLDSVLDFENSRT